MMSILCYDVDLGEHICLLLCHCCVFSFELIRKLMQPFHLVQSYWSAQLFFLTGNMEVVVASDNKNLVISRFLFNQPHNPYKFSLVQNLENKSNSRQ